MPVAGHGPTSRREGRGQGGCANRSLGSGTLVVVCERHYGPDLLREVAAMATTGNVRPAAAEDVAAIASFFRAATGRRGLEPGLLPRRRSGELAVACGS